MSVRLLDLLVCVNTSGCGGLSIYFAVAGDPFAAGVGGAATIFGALTLLYHQGA